MDEWRQLKPLEWCKYVNKEVKVTAHEKQQHNGWVFTVDPVSASIVLVTFQEKGGTPMVRVVTGHAVQEVEVLQEGNEEMAGRLRVVFTPPGARALGPEEVRRRKESLRLWLEKNRIPVEEEGEMLRVANVLTVSAPYGAEDCSSSNEIILAWWRATPIHLQTSLPTPDEGCTLTHRAGFPHTDQAQPSPGIKYIVYLLDRH